MRALFSWLTVLVVIVTTLVFIVFKKVQAAQQDTQPPKIEMRLVVDGRAVPGVRLATIPHGEAVKPEITVTDEIDPDPQVYMCVYPAGQAVKKRFTFDDLHRATMILPGKAIRFDEPGQHYVHAFAVDRSGNQHDTRAIVTVQDTTEKIGATTKRRGTICDDIRPEPPASSNNNKPHTKRRRGASAEIIIDERGTRTSGDVINSRPDVIRAVVERVVIDAGPQGVRELRATLLVTSHADLSRLNHHFVSMWPTYSTYMPISQLGEAGGSRPLKPTQTEYLADRNIWRLCFETTFDPPLKDAPRAFHIACSVGRGEVRASFFTHTKSAWPDAARINALLGNADDRPRDGDDDDGAGNP